jgi:hypothetical protein
MIVILSHHIFFSDYDYSIVYDFVFHMYDIHLEGEIVHLPLFELYDENIFV